MINLLPPEEKKILSAIKRQKMVLILGLVIFIFFVSLALILASLNVSISSKIAEQKVILAQKERELEAADTDDLGKKITEINQSLQKLENFYQKSTNFTVFLEKISNLLPAGVSLKSISINLKNQESSVFQVYLSGSADSIESLIMFNENLKEDENLSEIYFPVDTWLQKNDFNFSVTFLAIIKK